jgi:hypothetical protein
MLEVAEGGPVIGPRMAVLGGACAVLLLAAACRAAPKVTGSYELRAINQQPLPFKGGAVSGTWIEVTGGALALHPDGTYERRLLLTTHAGRAEHPDSTIQTGTYVLRMSTVVMHTAGGDETADLVGNALVMSIRGWRYLFRKPAI